MISDGKQLTAVEAGDAMRSHRTEVRIPVTPSSPSTVYELMAPRSYTARPWEQTRGFFVALPCLA